jgi:hypothetical protein
MSKKNSHNNNQPPNEIDEQKVLQYIDNNNTLPQEEYAIEQQMEEDAFLKDAIEGLQAMNNKQNIEEYVIALNHQLKKQINQKKKRKEKRKLQKQYWIIITTVTILILVLLGYFIIRQLMIK